ncbi:protein serine/threonine phosphatase 2C [Peniophora sp. CONT]|nr:protein serine/threonine phosphatase 2C [Peniophora sp. CONT]
MLNFCTSSRLVEEQCVVDTVSFQPCRGKDNEDRVVAQTWDVLGHRWLFLAVFDGHGGSATSDYAARILPGRLCSALRSKLGATFEGHIHKGQTLDTCVGRMLEAEIKAFDHSLGQFVKDLFPHPRGMAEEDVKRLISENEETIMRAYFGSTLVGALVALDLKYMWHFGLGDSTIMVTTASSRNPVNTPRYKVLNTHHTLRTPQEYLTQKLKHPSEENFIDNGRFMLGGTELTRALGDYHYKLSSQYVHRIFRQLPSASKRFDYSGRRNKTPPYITNDPEIGYLDLGRFKQPKLILFSDGVDSIVQSLHCSPDSFRTVKPGLIMAQLVSSRSASYAGNELGHAVEPGWNGSDGNRAMDVLGNLLGGSDANRLSRVLDQTVLSSSMNAPEWDPSRRIYIDDTTIAVCDLTF